MVVELLQANKLSKQLTTVPVTQVDIFKTFKGIFPAVFVVKLDCLHWM